MDRPAHIFLGVVVHGFVGKAFALQIGINTGFVGIDRRACFDVLNQVRHDTFDCG